jgi:hypothetical protein
MGIPLFMHNSFVNMVMQIPLPPTTSLTFPPAVVLRRAVFSHAPLPFEKNNTVASSVQKITEFREPKRYSKSITCEPQ